MIGRAGKSGFLYHSVTAFGAGDIELAAAARNAQQLFAALALKVFILLTLLPTDFILGKRCAELIIKLQKGIVFGAALFKPAGHHAEDGKADPQNTPGIEER